MIGLRFAPALAPAPERRLTGFFLDFDFPLLGELGFFTIVLLEDERTATAAPSDVAGLAGRGSRGAGIRARPAPHQHRWRDQPRPVSALHGACIEGEHAPRRAPLWRSSATASPDGESAARAAPLNRRPCASKRGRPRRRSS